MIKINTPPLGIIEGFFGRSWTWQDRKAYAGFLAPNALNFYIYAPKSDVFLRKQWHLDWPEDIKGELIRLREIYRTTGIDFGIGLSPYEIYKDPNQDKRRQLTRRVQQINTITPDILCLLFDDMRGDLPNLASIQIDIANQVAATTTARKIIFCPTYYSFDPVLEKVFGSMPENYWQDLHKHLDKKIDIFWTGEKVCSAEYPLAHLATVTELFGRKPFLWDNYPVNDGALKSHFLQLRSVSKSHSAIQDNVAGHALNPMNQPCLSQLAIASLPRAYRERNRYDPEQSLYDACIQLCGGELADFLLADLSLFQDKGLQKLSATEKSGLINRYAQFPQNPFCLEIIEWLNGGYEFDPACLTE